MNRKISSISIYRPNCRRKKVTRIRFVEYSSSNEPYFHRWNFLSLEHFRNSIAPVFRTNTEKKLDFSFIYVTRFCFFQAVIVCMLRKNSVERLSSFVET